MGSSAKQIRPACDKKISIKSCFFLPQKLSKIEKTRTNCRFVDLICGCDNDLFAPYVLHGRNR
jgi:hypothetical protein